MANQVVQRRKRELSVYQKEIRFLTGLSVAIGILLVSALVWLLNTAYFKMHW